MRTQELRFTHSVQACVVEQVYFVKNQDFLQL